mmetsp:Transcript_14007/g.36178  ORF Transcript_14007/g.36178 Transcript_14007/m.36178 type:complete len:442 (+) Transcript_14007:104-1429(+)
MFFTFGWAASRRIAISVVVLAMNSEYMSMQSYYGNQLSLHDSHGNLPLKIKMSIPCVFNSSLRCYNLTKFCYMIDVLGAHTTALQLDAAFASSEDLHDHLSILVHTYASHVTERYLIENVSAFWQTIEYSPMVPTVQTTGARNANVVFTLAWPHMLHGFNWQVILNFMQSQTCLASQASCTFNTSFFMQSARRICPGSEAKCAHGLGHGAMLAVLYIKRNWKQNSCQPLKYHQFVISDGELRVALNACRLTFPSGLNSVCASGVYHTYTSFYPEVPQSDRWRIPCCEMDLFSEACFMFTLQNYDAASVVRNTEVHLVSPLDCVAFAMKTEGTVRGCLFVSAAQWSLFQLPLDNICETVATKSPPRYRNERWAVCWASSLHYITTNEFFIKCHQNKSHKPALVELVDEICQSHVSLLQWKVYPTRLLQGIDRDLAFCGNNSC